MKIKDLIVAESDASTDEIVKKQASEAGHVAATEADQAYTQAQQTTLVADATLASALGKTGPILSTVTNTDGSSSPILYESDNTPRGWHTVLPKGDDTDVPA